LIIVITGPLLAVAGIGGSLWGLAGFLVIFGVAVVPLIIRGLRPAVTLISSSEQTGRLPWVLVESEAPARRSTGGRG
jgi:hypothetical protein